MKHFTHHKQVLAKKIINDLYSKSQQALNLIHQDYFGKLTFEQFKKNHLGMDGLVAQILTYRFCNESLLAPFVACAKKWIKKNQGLSRNDTLLLHPCFNIRYCYPEMYASAAQQKAFLDSPPHFDMSWGIPQFTIWIPLVPIEKKSGGICFFKSNEFKKYYPVPHWNDTKSYKQTDYLKAAKRADPLLKKSCLLPKPVPGDMIIFNSNILHGGLKAIQKPRISMDFRLVLKSDFEKASPRSKRVFGQIWNHFEISRTANLMVLGDYLGASRILGQMHTMDQSTLLNLSRALSAVPVNPAILKTKQLLDWKKEYSWIGSST